MAKRFPDHFLFGTATAATQIEGGDVNSNWFTWSELGKINNGHSSIVAADHYNRVEEDIALMASLHQQTYRMSIEWSRIYPKKGKVSQEGIDHYVNELKALKDRGILPLVTLHHFSSPQWIDDLGGWTSVETITHFIEFVETIVTALGDLCSEYCTINEPNVFVNDTYMDGKYPPGDEGNIKGYFKASKHLILAHLKAYTLIHSLRKQHQFKGETKVGFAHHLAVLDSDGRHLSNFSRSIMDYSFHTIFFNGMVDGKLTFPLGHGYPEGKGTFCDFIGINYYSRHVVVGNWNIGSLFGEITVDESKDESLYNDLGWEIYPKGLARVIKDVNKKYPMPIYITENGIANSDDTKRGRYIEEHLAIVLQLIDEGIPIDRYYHWSLMDNLEWNDGYGPRFGLIEINYETLERRIRHSGKYYGTITKHRQLIPLKDFEEGMYE